MRQPLWVINASLLCIILVSELIFFAIQTSIPRRFSLTPGAIKLQEKKIAIDVDITKIYQASDLFDTYIPEIPVLAKGASGSIPAIPLPPPAIPLQIDVEKPPVFIPPLAATLKGVVYLHDDSEESTAIVQFKDSKKEYNYRVGEMILDAQILKIFPNRIIVVRSNGQQETLYLRPKDLEKEFAQEMHKDTNNFVVTFKDNKHYVPLVDFLKQVHSLGQFIDELGLRSVFRQGKSVGCRVTIATKDSLGGKLGFERDDLIQKIDSIEVEDLDSRITIYDHIIQKKIGDEIVVELERDGTLSKMVFVISEHQVKKAASAKGQPKAKGIMNNHEAVEEQKQKILSQRVKLAPTAHQIYMAEQKKLLEARKKNMLSRQHVQNR